MFILGHVASFAVGAGPIPFVLIGEVVPSYVSLAYWQNSGLSLRLVQAAGSAGSLGLAVNWSANFIVGLGFLPLKNALSGGARDGQGNVFFVFAGLTAFFLLVLSRLWRV
jgi:MFS transporter, SP family, solute carrier family 2 (facilitated glucose transporter), member 3